MPDENDNYKRLRAKICNFEQSDEIVRGRAGILLPTKNAFDFVTKPEFQLLDDNRRGDGNSDRARVGHS